MPTHKVNLCGCILFFGLIRKYKGLDLLIEAFSLLKTNPNNKLLIAGEFYEDNVEVISGVNNGDIIITQGYQTLYDGQFLSTK